MKVYPDPYRFFARYLKQAGKQRVRELKREGFPATSREHLSLLVALDIEECKQRYIQEVEKVLDQNIKGLVRGYRIRRACRELCFIACPQLALFLAALAWYCFRRSWGGIVGTYCIAAAFAFLGMFLFGWIWDRRRRSGGEKKHLSIKSSDE